MNPAGTSRTNIAPSSRWTSLFRPRGTPDTRGPRARSRRSWTTRSRQAPPASNSRSPLQHQATRRRQSRSLSSTTAAGMDPFTLRQALRFGGSTRFGDRSGLGQYGMGLPGASLSQARRVTVYHGNPQAAQQDNGQARSRGEIAPTACTCRISTWTISPAARWTRCRARDRQESASGVRRSFWHAGLWTQCDRLDNRRISTVVRRNRG